MKGTIKRSIFFFVMFLCLIKPASALQKTVGPSYAGIGNQCKTNNCYAIGTGGVRIALYRVKMKNGERDGQVEKVGTTVNYWYFSGASDFIDIRDKTDSSSDSIYLRFKRSDMRQDYDTEEFYTRYGSDSNLKAQINPTKVKNSVLRYSTTTLKSITNVVGKDVYSNLVLSKPSSTKTVMNRIKNNRKYLENVIKDITQQSDIQDIIDSMNNYNYSDGKYYYYLQYEPLVSWANRNVGEGNRKKYNFYGTVTELYMIFAAVEENNRIFTSTGVSPFNTTNGENGFYKLENVGIVSSDFESPFNKYDQNIFDLLPVYDNYNSIKSYYIMKEHPKKALGVGYIVLNDLVSRTDVEFIKTNNNDNQSIIIRTKDDKYILLDTADNNVPVDYIYDKLRSMQQKKDGERVVIDYIIISHLDSDHYGNATTIMNDTSRFYIDKLIIKEEKLKKGIYTDIVNTANNNYIDVINVTDKEQVLPSNMSFNGDKLSLNLNDTKIYFYNTNDIYTNYAKECTTNGSFNVSGDSNLKKGYIVKFKRQSTKSNSVTDLNGKYVYLKNIPNTEYAYSTSVTSSTFNGFVYKKLIPVCRSNANAIAVLVEVNNFGSKKYMYFPSDLDNNGYPVVGEKDSNGNLITGTGTTYFFTNLKDMEDRYLKQNKSNGIKNVKVASEYDVAKKIKNDINVNNIVLYQMAHHGQNNTKEAINELGLNRNNLYAVAQRKNPDYNDYNIYNSFNITLSKTNKLTATYSDVSCSLNFYNEFECH